MKVTMDVKLDAETRERLKALGEKKERSPHWLMIRAIQEYLDREEAYEREKQEDLDRWRQYVATGEYVDHETVRARLAALAEQARRKGKATGRSSVGCPRPFRI